MQLFKKAAVSLITHRCFSKMTSFYQKAFSMWLFLTCSDSVCPSGITLCCDIPLALFCTALGPGRCLVGQDTFLCAQAATLGLHASFQLFIPAQAVAALAA